MGDRKLLREKMTAVSFLFVFMEKMPVFYWMMEFTHVYVFTLIGQLRGETSFGERKREMA